MPADDPREPRFDTTPAPRLGPADPLRSQTPRYEHQEPEPAAEPSWMSYRMVAGGIAVAVVLAGSLVYAIGNRGSAPAPISAPPSPPAPTAEAPTAGPETPPAQPATPPAASAPAATPVPAPAPTPASPPSAVAPAPVKPAPAPPETLHPAAPPAKTAVVPQEGPKHHRHTAESSGNWLVQVGAFHAQDRAQAAADALVKHGWPAHAVRGHEDWFLVEVTGYKTRADAEAASQKLAAKEHVDTLVRQVRRGTGTPTSP
ncbi:MAG TPA: SPOR domain-containing protein [Stellaceae bacterium]|nr:SPOR domain-containing protein [Stellaceae bacterium]